MTFGTRKQMLIVLGAALLLVGWVYRDSFASIVLRWSNDAAYSHGFLILPISLWIAWRKRYEVAAATWQPSWLGVVAVVAGVATWVVARGTGLLVVEQFAAVALVPALVLAILGRHAFRILVFPLLFLFFAVPFGRALVPWLMQLTADVATWALSASGIPILRSHMYISIPSGSFEVARACSGLNYVITGLVLGVLYAYMTYTKPGKRLLCLIAFLIVPIVANGFRVYFTIAVSHLTEMRYGPGAEHVTFGRVLFPLVMLIMFWVGRRWQDLPVATSVPSRPSVVMQPTLRSWAPVPFAFAAALVGPPYLSSSMAQAAERLGNGVTLVALPGAAAGWEGPLLDDAGWKPLYVDAVTERSAGYVDPSGSRVDVYLGLYGLGATSGAEMISYRNRIYAGEHASFAREVERDVALPGGAILRVREQAVADASGERLVWYWFMVGDRHATSGIPVKLLEARAFLVGDAQVERILTLSTRHDAAAAQRLQSFVEANADCIASGLDAAACR